MQCSTPGKKKFKRKEENFYKIYNALEDSFCNIEDCNTFEMWAPACSPCNCVRPCAKLPVALELSSATCGRVAVLEHLAGC